MTSILAGLALLAGLVILACEEGPVGKAGLDGPPGTDGSDAVHTLPADRVFSLAIFNGTRLDHNGVNVLALTFDSLAAPTGSMVVANRLASPPVIDGIDGGNSEWGAKLSTITLSQQAYNFNYITSAKVKAGYDDYNVYFLVSWTEVQGGTKFVVGENTQQVPWIRRSNAFVLDTTKYEDRLGLLFEATPVQYWSTEGCLTACHVGVERMRTPATNAYMDLWLWGSVRSNKLGIALDKMIDGTAGIVDDAGTPAVFPNYVQVNDTTFNTRYMHYRQRTESDYVAEDPMWDYNAVAPVKTTGWTATSTLPGWIAQTPSKGNDLIKCKGVFSNGTWTVEFSRPRITEEVSDVDF